MWVVIIPTNQIEVGYMFHLWAPLCPKNLIVLSTSSTNEHSYISHEILLFGQLRRVLEQKIKTKKNISYYKCGLERTLWRVCSGACSSEWNGFKTMCQDSFSKWFKHRANSVQSVLNSPFHVNSPCDGLECSVCSITATFSSEGISFPSFF